jgi:hypothetical protein
LYESLPMPFFYFYLLALALALIMGYFRRPFRWLLWFILIVVAIGNALWCAPDLKENPPGAWWFIYMDTVKVHGPFEVAFIAGSLLTSYAVAFLIGRFVHPPPPNYPV